MCKAFPDHSFEIIYALHGKAQSILGFFLKTSIAAFYSQQLSLTAQPAKP
jgi:hypothetical protein